MKVLTVQPLQPLLSQLTTRVLQLSLCDSGQILEGPVTGREKLQWALYLDQFQVLILSQSKLFQHQLLQAQTLAWWPHLHCHLRWAQWRLQVQEFPIHQWVLLSVLVTIQITLQTSNQVEECSRHHFIHLVALCLQLHQQDNHWSILRLQGLVFWEAQHPHTNLPVLFPQIMVSKGLTHQTPYTPLPLAMPYPHQPVLVHCKCPHQALCHQYLEILLCWAFMHHSHLMVWTWKNYGWPYRMILTLQNMAIECALIPAALLHRDLFLWDLDFPVHQVQEPAVLTQTGRQVGLWVPHTHTTILILWQDLCLLQKGSSVEKRRALWHGDVNKVRSFHSFSNSFDFYVLFCKFSFSFDSDQSGFPSILQTLATHLQVPQY